MISFVTFWIIKSCCYIQLLLVNNLENHVIYFILSYCLIIITSMEKIFLSIVSYRDFYHIIIPELIMVKDVAVAKNIVVTMEMDWMEVLTACIPKVMVHILPLFAVSKITEVAAEEAVRRRTAHATSCYDLLSKEATKEVCILVLDWNPFDFLSSITNLLK